MLNQNFCGVYRIKSMSTGMVYFGSAENMVVRRSTHLRDLRQGKHHNRPLQELYDLHGEQDLRFFVVKRYVDVADARDHEQRLIRNNRYANVMLNISLGVNGGDNYTRHHDKPGVIKRRQESIRKTVDAMSPEERQASWGRAGEDNGMFGMTHTAEVKEQLAALTRGNQRARGGKWSAEARAQLSAFASTRTGEANSFYGKKHSEETKKRQSEIKKAAGRKPRNRLRVSINGVEYDSLDDAAKGEGVSVYYIRKWLQSDDYPECKYL